jgi:hypothetical protein
LVKKAAPRPHEKNFQLPHGACLADIVMLVASAGRYYYRFQ